MYEFKCLYCGRTKAVRHKHDITACCSRRCAARYRIGLPNEVKDEDVIEDYDESLEWKRSSSMLWICPYAENVECMHRICISCGWHPQMEAERDRKIQKGTEVEEMAVTRMKNPCEGCKRQKDPDNCSRYITCADYRFWINWNWKMFRGYPMRMALKKEVR